MSKMILFKVGSKEAQLPKMIGGFLVIIAVLMLIQAGAVMFDSWQALKDFNTCVEFSGVKEMYNLDSAGQILAELRYQDCKNSLYEITGAQVIGADTTLSSRQFWTGIIGPVVNFFAWAIVFLFALFLFNSAEMVVPVEMAEVPLAARPFKKRK
ncbi:MAG: hypothetical protein AABW59_00360 [archaeon]